MPTPSMSLPLGRVLLSADSQSRVLPVGSLYWILLHVNAAMQLRLSMIYSAD